LGRNRPGKIGAGISRRAFSSPAELLESRLLLSVSQDSNGWTVVTPSTDTRMIYVSASVGSDLNSGLSASSPVKTLAKAQSLVLSGEPDWVLLKAGDIFHDNFYNWSASGRSAQEPILISSYGTGARPLIDSGTASAGFNVRASTTLSINYVDLIGLQFYENNRDPASPTFNTSSAGGTTGFQWYAPGGNVLIENCEFSYYRNNLDIESVNGQASNFVIRRCISADSWSTTSHSQGMYCFGVSNLSVLQCDFDHNGWNTMISGAYDAGYNHDMYFSSTCTGISVQGSVIAEASYSGVMARGGGNIDNNLFVDDAVAVSFGDANGADSAVGGVTGSLVGNAIVGDKSSNGTPYGQGFEIGNTTPGAGMLVADNIFTQDTQYAKAAIELTMATATYNPQDAVGDNDVTIENNIVNGWYQAIDTSGLFVPGGTGLYALNDLKVLNNTLLNSKANLVRHDGAYAPATENWAGNTYYDPTLSTTNWTMLQGINISFNQWLTQVDQTGKVLTSLPYADPNRSVATYDATLGGPGTWQDFLVQAQTMSYTNYQPQYMAAAVISYIANGFTVDTTAPTAAANTTNLNTTAIGSTTYTFTVDYTDNFFLNPNSLGSANLLVTGPNGFSAPAAFVSAAAPTIGTAGVQQTIATYQINAPSGAWAMGQDGTYTITLLPNQVSDKTGNAAASAVVGTFIADFTPPTALPQVTDLTDSSANTSTYSFTITYSDASGINATTLNSNQLLVTGPAGYSQYATLVSEMPGTNSAGQLDLVASYSITAPNGAWTSDADGAYTITAPGGTINDLLGNSLAAGVLATFNVLITGGDTTTSSTASISGIIFNDANGNGILDSRETPLVGARVFLDLAGTGQLAAGDPTAVTDSNGNYTFSNLAAGQYKVVEIPPAGYQSPAAMLVTLTTGQTLTAINFADEVGNTATSGITNGTGTTGTATTGTTTTGTTTTGNTHGSQNGSKAVTGKPTQVLKSLLTAILNSRI
jgi:hypothetical protein